MCMYTDQNTLVFATFSSVYTSRIMPQLAPYKPFLALLYFGRQCFIVPSKSAVPAAQINNRFSWSVFPCEISKELNENHQVCLIPFFATAEPTRIADKNLFERGR